VRLRWADPECAPEGTRTKTAADVPEVITPWRRCPLRSSSSSSSKVLPLLMKASAHLRLRPPNDVCEGADRQ